MSQPVTADQLYTHPVLAELYDLLDPDRSDLDFYRQIISKLPVRSVLDIGCGTGVFACQMATAGYQVTGVDPASASLTVAQRKAGAEQVRWILGTALDLEGHLADAAVMTANVAMVFVSDEDWLLNLQAIAKNLNPGGYLIFEARRPEVRAWEGWTEESTRETQMVKPYGRVTSWVDVLSFTDKCLTFRETFVFEDSAKELFSESVLRYRSRQAFEDSLSQSGFKILQVLDAPDRPGRQLVFVAQKVL